MTRDPRHLLYGPRRQGAGPLGPPFGGLAEHIYGQNSPIYLLGEEITELIEALPNKELLKVGVCEVAVFCQDNRLEHYTFPEEAEIDSVYFEADYTALWRAMEKRLGRDCLLKVDTRFSGGVFWDDYRAFWEKKPFDGQFGVNQIPSKNNQREAVLIKWPDEKKSK